MNFSTFNSWETPHTTTDDNTFHSEDEPRRAYWTSPMGEIFYSGGELRRIYLLSSPPPPSTPRKMKRKLEIGMCFPKRTGVSQHVCEACGQVIPQQGTFKDRQLKTRTLKAVKLRLRNYKTIISFTYM